MTAARGPSAMRSVGSGAERTPRAQSTRRPAGVAFALAAFVATVGVGCRAPTDCDGGLDDGVVRVVVGARLDARGLDLGSTAACARGAAYDAFTLARRARAALGDAAPSQVTIAWRPKIASGAPVDGVEVQGGVVLANEAVSLGAWGHELVHVAVFERRRDRGASPPPGGPTAHARLPVERLAAAAEEGVADSIASIRIGPIDRPRSNAAASADWSALALDQLRFDPHPLGERFAAALAAHPPVEAGCLVEMLAQAQGDTPAALVRAWTRRCPAAAPALEAWVPAALRGTAP